MRRFVIIAAVFSLAVPAAFAAPPPGKGKPEGAGPKAESAQSPSASDLCKRQRQTIGMAAFRQLYAQNGTPKAAMDACLLKQVQVSSTAAKNAAKACKAEQADPNFAGSHGGKTFTQFYGTNGNGMNAFGKCVSSKVKSSVQSQQSNTVNAAKKCKAEQADPNFAGSHGGKTFTQYYGTNGNGRNAFGKCVSKLAQQQGKPDSDQEQDD